MLYYQKKTRNIHEAAFQNCLSLEYMHYDHTLEIIDPSTPSYKIDIKEINLFGENVFRNCTNLESIKIYEYLLESWLIILLLPVGILLGEWRW